MKIYPANEIVQKLQSEKSEPYYYRGQTREYPGPLWPSEYRSFFRSEDCLTINKPISIRKSGNQFNLRMGAFNWEPFESEKVYNEFVKRQQAKIFIKNHIRNALGFPLSEAFFQQVGLRSTGLDVTDNLDVALFFALYEWNGNTYVPKNNSDEYSVIYRWKIETPPWTLDTLNKFDFFSCPRLIPVKKVFKLFNRCSNMEESEASITRYKHKINWGVGRFDLESIRFKRPFNVIAFHEEAIVKSRINQQHASLLIPDEIEPEDFLKNYGVNSNAVVKEIRSGRFVEDLAKHPTCEIFRFSNREISSFQHLKSISPDVLFPKDDILFKTLRGWLGSFIRNPYGILPIFSGIQPDMPYGEFINLLLNEFESEFFI